MNQEGMTNSQQEFIEELAQLYEQFGLIRMAGRIYAALLVSEKQEVSAGELAEILSASKGSISSMSRLLIQGGTVEKVTLPGDRKEYYRLRSDAYGAYFKNRHEIMKNIVGLAARELDALPKELKNSRKRLKEFQDFYVFLHSGIEKLMKEWEKKK